MGILNAQEMKEVAGEHWGERIGDAARNRKASLLDPRLRRSYSTTQTEGTLNIIGNGEIPYVKAGKRSQFRAYSVSCDL